jgi:hypothetical protein
MHIEAVPGDRTAGSKFNATRAAPCQNFTSPIKTAKVTFFSESVQPFLDGYLAKKNHYKEDIYRQYLQDLIARKARAPIFSKGNQYIFCLS